MVTFKDLIHNAMSGGDAYTRLLLMSRRRDSKRIVAKLMEQTDSISARDIGDWRNAWQAAISVEYPNRSRLYDIYRSALIDMHLTGCISQRENMVLQKSFRLVGKDGKENEAATDIFRSEWFTDFMQLALDSRYWGHSLIQMGDIVNNLGKMRYSGVELVPRKHVCPEHGVITRLPGDDWRSGESYREGEFASWCIEVGKPHDLGLLLKCAPPCISKKYMLQFWDKFGEIFGAPIRIAKTSNANEAERTKIEMALTQMGNASWGLFDDNTDIEIKETAKSDAFNVYDRRIDRANSEISKGILNQTMTIDNGSSLSQSETHLEVFENVIKADARDLAYVINDKLLPLMVSHGFPVAGLQFQWDDAATFTPSELREEERVIMEHFEVDPQYFIDRYNIPIIGKRKAADPDDFFR